MMWTFNLFFLHLTSCTILVSYEIEVFNLIRPFLLVPFLLVSSTFKGLTFCNKKYTTLHKMLNLGFRKFKRIFLKIYFLIYRKHSRLSVQCSWWNDVRSISWNVPSLSNGHVSFWLFGLAHFLWLHLLL